MPLLKAHFERTKHGDEYRGICLYCSGPIRFEEDRNGLHTFSGVLANCAHVRGLKSTGLCRWFIVSEDPNSAQIHRAAVPPQPRSLSEAILEGSKRGTQLFGRLIDEQGNTCTTGAALLALGYTYDDIRHLRGLAGTIVRDVYPVATETENCPECGQPYEVLRLMAHLQDNHGWTREAIASVVARVESRQLEHI